MLSRTEDNDSENRTRLFESWCVYFVVGNTDLSNRVLNHLTISCR